MASYLSQKVQKNPSKKSGFGLFAMQKIHKGEIIVDYAKGTGEYINSQKADELFQRGRDQMIQVGNDLFFAAIKEVDVEDADYVNHSCNPNCGIKSKLQVVAMRDIEVGEEITIDYAMMESSAYSFSCNCDDENCRKIVAGDDWMIKSLQKKYTGYFSDYLQEKINNSSNFVH